jgi:hypothetical protein
MMTHRNQLAGAVLLVLCVLLSAGSATAKDVLIDESHGQVWSFFSDAKFSMARAALINAGHTLSNLPGSPGAITGAALAGHDVFFTGTLDQSYTASEIQALQSYVDAGGCVLVTHDGGWSSDDATPSVNTFLSPYGMQMAGGATYASGVVVTGFVDHCLTDGVQTLGLDYVRELSVINAPAVDLTTGSVEILAVYENNGSVAVLGDDTLWSDPGGTTDYDITDYDNQAVLLNLVDCCGVVSPVEAMSWGTIKGMYR